MIDAKKSAARRIASGNAALSPAGASAAWLPRPERRGQNQALLGVVDEERAIGTQPVAAVFQRRLKVEQAALQVRLESRHFHVAALAAGGVAVAS